jgi:putative transposase
MEGWLKVTSPTCRLSVVPWRTWPPSWLDLYSRKILGWQVASTMTAELVIGALRQAIVRERMPRGLIVHIDRGGQNVDAEFRQLLQDYGYRQSVR